jgi:hypothetical protein
MDSSAQMAFWSKVYLQLLKALEHARDPRERWHMHLLIQQEGVTQGDPISMVACGIGVLPLIHQLKHEFPEVEQPWYMDNAGAAGNFDSIRRHLTKLQKIGLNNGYFPSI